MSQVSFVSRLPANVTVQVFQAIGKGVTQRSAVVFKDGEQVGTMFTADSTNEVREAAAKFYVETFVDRVHDKRKAPKAWVVNIETGERKRVSPDEVSGYVESGKYRAGRDIAPVSAQPKVEGPHGLKGRHWFHKGSERVRLHAYEVAAHMAEGFVPGKGSNTKYPETVVPVPTLDPHGIAFNA